MRLLVTAALLMSVQGGEHPASSNGPCREGTLYCFLSPSTPGAGELARKVGAYVKSRKGEVVLRTVLLVEDFGALGRLEKGSELFIALKEFESSGGRELSIPLYDEEGLALARRWKISRLPALVLARDGRAHVAFGSRADLRELEECP